MNVKKGPEDVVRAHTIVALKKLGWRDDQLQKEWPVPKLPNDLSKREKGQKYDRCGRADLAAFADDSLEPYALQVIFEFKAPKLLEGREQLIRYLSSEPMVKMGFWTNGTDSLVIYKSHSSEWVEIKGAPLPSPSDDFTQPPKEPLKWVSLREPSEVELTSALRRLVATTVSADHLSSRREDQLKELLHLILVKIESDAWASAPAHQEDPVPFRIYGDKLTMAKETGKEIRKQFSEYFARQRNRVFDHYDSESIKLTDETVLAVVDTLSPWRLLGDDVEILAKAFQIFRTKAMKSGEGQFLTPQRIIQPCVKVMEITSQDKVIDPACGSGGFLVEALRQVRDTEFGGAKDDVWRLVKFANDNLYGVDKDRLGVKLSKAMMIAMQDGSTHTLCGDMVRRHLWAEKFPALESAFGSGIVGEVAGSFSVVLTNPPFGKPLKVSASDCQKSGYSISRAAANSSSKSVSYCELEIGLIYLELAYDLLQVGGRLGIVLPETYFFSHTYRWLPGWMESRFALKGMLNIPMEAFEEFCRAKTNFYIFEKLPEPESEDKKNEAA